MFIGPYLGIFSPKTAKFAHFVPLIDFVEIHTFYAGSPSVYEHVISCEWDSALPGVAF